MFLVLPDRWLLSLFVDAQLALDCLLQARLLQVREEVDLADGSLAGHGLVVDCGGLKVALEHLEHAQVLNGKVLDLLICLKLRYLLFFEPLFE